MYYEERMIDGILHWRGTPDGAWRLFHADEVERRAGMRWDLMQMANAAYRRADDAAFYASMSSTQEARKQYRADADRWTAHYTECCAFERELGERQQ